MRRTQRRVYGEASPEWTGRADGSGAGQVVDRPTTALLADIEAPVEYRARAKAKTRGAAFGPDQIRNRSRVYGESAVL